MEAQSYNKLNLRSYVKAAVESATLSPVLTYLIFSYELIYIFNFVDQ